MQMQDETIVNRQMTRVAVYAIIAVVLAAFMLFMYRFVVTDRLNTAAKQGDLPAVRALLSRGAVVNGRGMHSMTPLMAAAEGGQAEIVRFLIDQGADVNAHNGSGSVLMWAAASGNKDTVRLLLSRGANVHWQEEYGGTALTIAKQYKHPEIADMVTRAGAT